MEEAATPIEAHLQRMVNAGISGIDIMHGELKNLMLIAEKEFTEAVEVEEENDYADAMDGFERKYAEGYLDALVSLYKLTYDISFAIGEKE
jgi:hypothetical protein